MELSRLDREALERLEEELWREESRFELRRLNEVMSPDLFEIGKSGRAYQREEMLSPPRRPIEAVLPHSRTSRSGCWITMLRR